MKSLNRRTLSNISKAQKIVETFSYTRKTTIRNQHLIAALTCQEAKHQSKSKTFSENCFMEVVIYG